MPLHEWTHVGPGVFHHFHHEWISAISSSLSRRILPRGYYALVEDVGGLGRDLLAPELPERDGSGVHALRQPEADQYAAKANAVVIRHASGHEVVAMVEIISPGNKNTRHGLRSFLDKAEEVLRGGTHLLLIDLFPPGSFDSQGIHKAVWDRLMENDFALPADKPLTLAAYTGGPVQESFVEPVSVGQPLPDMPLFLTPDRYVEVPLERTYQEAWEDVPEFWRDVLSGDGEPR